MNAGPSNPEPATTPEDREDPEPSATLSALQVLADVTGDTVIRCVLPPDAPEGLPRGFDRAHREGRVLVATVPDADGLANLQAPSLPFPDKGSTDEENAAYIASRKVPPFGTAIWEDGACRVETPREVVVPGRVVFLDGPRTGTVNGCGGGFPVADDGSFEVITLEGPPCGLEFMTSNMGEPVMLDRRNPPAEVVVRERENPPMSERLAGLQAELDRLNTMADPFAVALEDPGLDDATRAQLEAWQAEDQAERDERIHDLDWMIAFFAKHEADEVAP